MSPLWKMAMAAGVVALAGCGSKPASPPPAPPAQAPSAPKAETAAPKPEPQEEQAPAVAEFQYDPKGLRDPFEPFIKLEEPKKKEKAKAFVPTTPLQRYALEEIRLVGIVWGEAERAVALVEDPEGKGYAVSNGTLIGDRGGRVLRIRPDRVEVEERFVDLFGEENVKVLSMTLRKPEGEVNP